MLLNPDQCQKQAIDHLQSSVDDVLPIAPPEDPVLTG